MHVDHDENIIIGTSIIIIYVSIVLVYYTLYIPKNNIIYNIYYIFILYCYSIYVYFMV